MSEATVRVHADRASLAAYVTGALAAADAAQLEAHVGACDDCAAALAREARFEVALGAVCAAPLVRAARVARIAGVGFASLAAAAAVLLALGAARAGNGALRSTHVAEGDGAATAGVATSPRQTAALYACADGADGEPCGSDGASPMQ